jgi:hypothetical protein
MMTLMRFMYRPLFLHIFFFLRGMNLFHGIAQLDAIAVWSDCISIRKLLELINESFPSYSIVLLLISFA